MGVSDDPPAIAPVHHGRDRRAESAPRRGRLEHPTIRPASRSLTPSTASGGIVPNSFAAARRLKRSSSANGVANSIIGSSRKYGPSMTTGSPYALPMNGTTNSGSWFRSYGNENWEFDEERPDAAAHRQHQRSADQGRRAQISLATRSPSRRSPIAERAGPFVRSRSGVAIRPNSPAGTAAAHSPARSSPGRSR